MTTPDAGAAPAGYHTVTPFVIVKGAAELLDFTREAFGAEEIGRVGEEGAIGHAETRIGDSVVMMFDAKPGWPSTPAFLRLYVDDCDATYQRALDAGGTSVTRPYRHAVGRSDLPGEGPAGQPLVDHGADRGS